MNASFDDLNKKLNFYGMELKKNTFPKYDIINNNPGAAPTIAMYITIEEAAMWFEGFFYGKTHFGI